jgi:hypothetical protein
MNWKFFRRCFSTWSKKDALAIPGIGLIIYGLQIYSVALACITGGIILIVIALSLGTEKDADKRNQ